MKNRQAEIKQKGFNMAIGRTEDVYANPALDFSKIKVGLKTLEDATVAIGDVKKAVKSGTLFVGGPAVSIDVLDLIYRHKEKQLREAEQRGYAEARKLYENKIDKLKAELKKMKESIIYFLSLNSKLYQN